METKLKKLSFFSFFLFFISISFVTSYSTVIDTLPDLCLPNNITSYNINLSDYWDIDLSETIYIDYIDPISLTPMSIPVGYYTVNTECFEMAYYFLSGYDFLSIETLDDTCSFDLTVDFQDSPGVDQTFNVNVSEDCETVNIPVNNGSCSYVDYLYSHDISQTWTAHNNPGNIRFCQERSFSSVNMTNLSFYIYNNYNSGSYNVDFRVRNDVSDSVVLQKNLYTSKTSDIDEGWYTVVFDTPSVLDGDYKICVEYTGLTDSTVKSYYASPSDLSNEQYTVYTTSYSDDSSKDLEYKFGYSSCDDVNSSLSGSIPDLNMSGDSTVNVDIGSYFSDWSDIILYVNDPITSYPYVFPLGYQTVNFDYYDIIAHTNGTFDFISYNRSYDYEVTVSACNGESNCVNDTFMVYIDSVLGDVIQRYPFTLLHNLEENLSQIFSGNYYFQYYDEIYVIYPESNESGVLNSTFPFLYNNVDNTSLNIYSSEGFPYLVYVYCDISDSYSKTVSSEGVFNVTVECGSNEFFITFNSNNYYYNNKVFFYAFNENSNITDYTNISSGYEFVGPVQNDSYDSHTGDGTFFGIFEDFEPSFAHYSSLNSKTKNTSLFIIYVILMGSIIVIFGRSPKIALILCLIWSNILLYFYYYMDFITLFYPSIFTLILVIYSFFQIKGGFS